jgi:hypothetical protein
MTSSGTFPRSSASASRSSGDATRHLPTPPFADVPRPDRRFQHIERWRAQVAPSAPNSPPELTPDVMLQRAITGRGYNPLVPPVKRASPAPSEVFPAATTPRAQPLQIPFEQDFVPPGTICCFCQRHFVSSKLMALRHWAACRTPGARVFIGAVLRAHARFAGLPVAALLAGGPEVPTTLPLRALHEVAPEDCEAWLAEEWADEPEVRIRVRRIVGAAIGRE